MCSGSSSPLRRLAAVQIPDQHSPHDVANCCRLGHCDGVLGGRFGAINVHNWSVVGGGKSLTQMAWLD